MTSCARISEVFLKFFHYVPERADKTRGKQFRSAHFLN